MTNAGVLRWGRVTKPDIPNPFAAGRIDGLSFAMTPLRIFAGQKYLGHASGFFWRRGDTSYLITNWHVVTGNNPFTRIALVEAPPSHLVAYDIDWYALDNGSVFPQRTEREIQLFDSDTMPVWLQHGKFDEYRTDVVAVPLPGWAVARQQFRPVCVNEFGFQALPHFAGSELFVVGYPLASFDGWMLPLWKRGSFASDPLIPVDDKPVFMIDVASSKGMSGSPVFRRVFGPTVSADLSTANPLSVMTTQFAGIYAGRLGTAELERVGMGYAWYGNVVEEILSTRVSGTTV